MELVEIHWMCYCSLVLVTVRTWIPTDRVHMCYQRGETNGVSPEAIDCGHLGDRFSPLPASERSETEVLNSQSRPLPEVSCQYQSRIFRTAECGKFNHPDPPVIAHSCTLDRDPTRRRKPTAKDVLKTNGGGGELAGGRQRQDVVWLRLTSK